MLRCYLIQRVVHELGHDLHNHPEGIELSLRGIEMLLKD